MASGPACVKTRFISDYESSIRIMARFSIWPPQISSAGRSFAGLFFVQVFVRLVGADAAGEAKAARSGHLHLFD
jgi:hypothetical protein